MTRNEIVQQIALRLFPEERKLATWSDLVSAVQASTSVQRTQLVKAVIKGSNTEAGEIMVRLMHAELKKKAVTSAETMLADDQLSLAELERIL